MSERHYIIGFAIGAMLLQVLLIGCLHSLGANSETIGSACVLVMGAEALGGGLIFMRYH